MFKNKTSLSKIIQKRDKMFNKIRFNNICRNIKEIKIQGATNVAKAALKAYYLFPSKKTKEILLHLRPTEPMLSHVISLADKQPREEIIKHFSDSQKKIDDLVFKLIKNDSRIFTHCHSTNVVKALVYSHKRGKRFEVYNTETRPLYQGRRTAKELNKAGIKVTNFIDSAASIAIKGCNLVLLGADALLQNSVINKVGSGMFAQIAFDNKIPVYIVADSWKYANRKVKLEQRNFKEIWGTKRIHIKNPAFEPINIRHIRGIVTELGEMNYSSFLNKVKNRS